LLTERTDVQRLLVPELPLPRRPGRLTGGPGVPDVVLAALAGAEVLEDLAQRGLPEPAQRLRRQRQARRPGQPALPFQLAFQFLQRLDVAAAPEPSARSTALDVDVVQGRAGVLLAELVDQVVEVGQLLQRPGRLAVAERLSPRIRCRSPAGPSPDPGAAPAGCRSVRPSSQASPLSPIAWAIRPCSSSRWRGVSEAISRSAAAARRASESISSSTFSGLSGNISPCLAMNSAKSCSCPRPGRAWPAAR
jgi:hypothetical protein